MSTFENLVGNNKKAVDESLQGFWGSKTASVNFCEHDYTKTPYVAELWNALSSFYLVFLAVVGLLHSNPTGDVAFTVCYLVLGVVGLGSVILHTTLTSLGQALDELPMLWMCSALFYAFLRLYDPSSKPKPSSFDARAVYILLFVAVQTTIYIQIQSLFHVFVCSYLSLVAIILSWSGYLAFNGEPQHMVIRKWLWKRAFGLYVGVGSATWFVDMHMCDELTPYQDQLGGVTLHIFWHFAAAAATYFMILLLVTVRMQHLGREPVLATRWMSPIIMEGKGKCKGQ